MQSYSWFFNVFSKKEKTLDLLAVRTNAHSEVQLSAFRQPARMMGQHVNSI